MLYRSDTPMTTAVCYQWLLGIAILIATLPGPFQSRAQAVPPRDEFKPFTQPDGRRVYLSISGDARFSWLETRRGYVVIHNRKSGYYEYAKMVVQDKKPLLRPSGIAVENGAGKLADSAGFTPLTRKYLLEWRRNFDLKGKGAAQN